MTRADFTTWGQEHLARAEEVADHAHAGHQRAFDDVQGPLGGEARFFCVGVDVFGDAVDESMGDAVTDRLLAPGQILGFGFAAGLAAIALR